MNTGKARVLTSAECLKALQEKENEKKRKAEEKEQRKQERLMKKQLKEEPLKRKKEEKAQQAALREAKRLEKQTKQPRQRKQRRRNTHVDYEAGSVTQNALTVPHLFQNKYLMMLQVITIPPIQQKTILAEVPQNENLVVKYNQLPRGQETMLMMRLILTGAACVLVTLLMMQAQGGSG